MPTLSKSARSFDMTCSMYVAAALLEHDPVALVTLAPHGEQRLLYLGDLKPDAAPPDIRSASLNMCLSHVRYARSAGNEVIRPLVCSGDSLTGNSVAPSGIQADSPAPESTVMISLLPCRVSGSSSRRSPRSPSPPCESGPWVPSLFLCNIFRAPGFRRHS